jgi:hypothetical protein
MEIYILEERHTTMYMPVKYFRTLKSATTAWKFKCEEVEGQGFAVNKEMSRTDKQDPSLLMIARSGREIWRVRKVQVEE